MIEKERVVTTGSKGITLYLREGVMYLKDFKTDELIEYDGNKRLEVKDKKLYLRSKK